MEQINHNGGNSSQPPSKDRYKKTSTQSLQESSRKSTGGQKRDTWKNAKIKKEDVPQEIFPLHPDCVGCPNRAECLANAKKAQTKYEVVVKINRKVIAHTATALECPMQNDRRRVRVMLSHMKSTLQYSNRVAALAVTFYAVA